MSDTPIQDYLDILNNDFVSMFKRQNENEDFRNNMALLEIEMNYEIMINYHKDCLGK